MSCNIVNEYIDFSRKTIKSYLKTILEHYYDQDIYDDLINAYINTRYYNMYPVTSKRFEVNIVYYLKKSIAHTKEESSKNKAKAKYMFQIFKYILYFDNVRECESVRVLIKEIDDYRKGLGLVDEDFESKFYNMLKNDLLAKKEFIDSFKDKNFNINYLKVKKQIFDCQLVHNIKFSKLYSEYAINKVLETKEIGEQKLFVTYSVVTTKILQDVIKGNFTKKYLVDYIIDLDNKPKKKKRLLTIINNDIVKEKIVLKINYNDYIAKKEEVYNLTREGYHIAIIMNDSKELDDDTKRLLKAFTYLIVSDNDIYEKLQDEFELLYIPS